MRSERWLYIRYQGGSEELYDHDADPLGGKNLAGEAQHEKIKAALAGWLPKVNAPDAPRRGNQVSFTQKALKKPVESPPKGAEGAKIQEDFSVSCRPPSTAFWTLFMSLCALSRPKQLPEQDFTSTPQGASSLRFHYNTDTTR